MTVGGELEEGVTGATDFGDGAARVAVPVLGGAGVQAGGLAGGGGVEGDHCGAAVGKAGFGDDGEVIVAPLDAAGVAVAAAGDAHGGFEDGCALAFKRGGEGEDAIGGVLAGGLAGDTAVDGLDPDEGGGDIGAPLVVAGTGFDGVAGDGEVIDGGAVVEVFHCTGFKGDDVGFAREALVGEGVAEGAVDGGDEGVPAVGGRGQGVDETFDGERLDRAGEGYDGELRGGVELKDVLVLRVLEHVLVGGGGADLTEVFGDCRTDGDFAFLGGGAAAGGNNLAEERSAVRQPDAGAAEDGVQMDEADAVGVGGGDIDDEELLAGRRPGAGFGDEGDVFAVWRPDGVAEK